MDDLSVLHGADIVFLSHQRWNTHTTAVQNTTLRLARDNRVLFFEPPDSIAWVRSEPAAREALTWILNPIERKSENLYIYHTPPLFLPGQARSRWISRSIIATFKLMIRHGCRRLGIQRPIFWVFQFNMSPIVRALRPRCTVYECAEEWDAYETDPQVKQYIREMDADLCRTADVVIVPSRALLEKKQPLNPFTHLVPWGVDTALYAQARSAETPTPADLRDLPRPIIGLVGMLDGRRLHTQMLREVALRHPDWSIVLVGRCMPNLDRSPLDPLPNVHFMGFRPVEEVPAYCKAFDVCMIPYMVNEFTRSIMPLKIIEYLATGKPVISTPLPAALECREILRIVHDSSEFEQHVLSALAEGPEAAEARIARAADYDWDVLTRRRMAAVASSLNGSSRADGHSRHVQEAHP